LGKSVLEEEIVYVTPKNFQKAKWEKTKETTTKKE
jgi:hypothetical protein